MKYIVTWHRPVNNTSPPSRGAWIEILLSRWTRTLEIPSPPSRGAWIEIAPLWGIWEILRSPPSRGAWIEI